MFDRSHIGTLLSQGFRLFQVFSLDVVGGALAVGVFAANTLHVSPNPWWWPVLALSVWVIYTADHLIDGYAKKQNAVILRHRFHYRYRRFFLVSMAVAALAALVLVWHFMDHRILLWGMFLGLWALGYLLLILLVYKSGFYFHKEFFISLFYVAGIWLAPVIWHGKPLSYSQILTLGVFVLLAWAEGLVMTLFEQKDDRADHMGSFSTYYGASFTKLFSGVLLSVALLASVFLLWDVPDLRKEYAILTAMATVLLVLLLFDRFFQTGQRYRATGEFTFWLPFLLLL